MLEQKISTRDAYGKVLVELGRRYPELVVSDADSSKSTKTSDFVAIIRNAFEMASQNKI